MVRKSCCIKTAAVSPLVWSLLDPRDPHFASSFDWSGICVQKRPQSCDMADWNPHSSGADYIRNTIVTVISRKSGLRRFGGLLTQRLSQARGDSGQSELETTMMNANVTREEFDKLMTAIDQGLRALPATGQVSFPPLL